MPISATLSTPVHPGPSPDGDSCIGIDVGGGRCYSLQVISKIHDLEVIAPQWSELAERSADPNVFYAPWCFLPAMRHLPPPRDWRIVLVWRDSSPNKSEKSLCGFFPFTAHRRYGGLNIWSLWNHAYCFLTNPLIEPGHEASVFQAVLEFASRSSSRAAALEFPLLAGDGPLHQALTDVIRDKLLTTFQFDHYLRATTPYHADSEELIKNNVNGHHLRELRRLRRKIESQGQLEYRQLQDVQGTDVWLDLFLSLEASGWKAEAGTAMQQGSDDSRFFREMVQAGVEQQRVKMEGLFLDGEPIALKVNLLSPPAAFAFKIAFDETRKKSSPGFQLELDSLTQFGLQNEITWADSCAAPGHPMINRIWKDRRVIQHLLVSTGHGLGDLLISGMPLARSLRRTAKRVVRRLTRRSENHAKH